ncbi:hypothetical protein WICMUC_004683 [Wickerhamomyces mucosus]|uniref:CNH domain-containing protein n=1 Tax=Wickerhamomyces mucosus TaxID=1378264 RepID=A0A9P8TA02_9ASCO|nr:hypothetical protein WICMUC_004683 [Wickerhamomyces mucosus]
MGSDNDIGNANGVEDQTLDSPVVEEEIPREQEVITVYPIDNIEDSIDRIDTQPVPTNETDTKKEHRDDKKEKNDLETNDDNDNENDKIIHDEINDNEDHKDGDIVDDIDEDGEDEDDDDGDLDSLDVLINFHKIINDKIKISTITNYKDNLYIGTKMGEIYHLINIDLQFILVSKTNLYEDQQNSYSIDRIIALESLNKLMIFSNKAIIFYDFQLSKSKSKNLNDVENIYQDPINGEITIFKINNIKVFNSKLKSIKKIDFENSILGLKFENLVMVLNNQIYDEGPLQCYDLIDLDTSLKIPIHQRDLSINPFIKLLPKKREILITIKLGIPMGVFINENGDTSNSLTLDDNPIDIFISKDQFIIISYPTSIKVYYNLNKGVKLVYTKETHKKMKFASIEGLKGYKIEYYNTKDNKMIEVDIVTNLVTYNNKFIEIFNFDKVQSLIYLNDLDLIKAQMELLETNSIEYQLWLQFLNIITLEKFEIDENIDYKLLLYIMGLEDIEVIIFNLLKDRIYCLKEKLKDNIGFNILFKNKLKELLKTMDHIGIKILFLEKFKDDDQLIKENLLYLKVVSEEESQKLIDWFIVNKKSQLLLEYYKVIGDVKSLKIIYKQLLKGEIHDPKFNKYDKFCISLFKNDLTILEHINDLTYVDINNFSISELIEFLKIYDINQDESFFWNFVKVLVVKENQLKNINNLKKNLLKSKLRNLSK